MKKSPTWLYWFFLFWWFLCITSLTKETLQGFAACARKHRHAKRSKPHLLLDLPLNYNPPPYHYDSHHDYCPPPSQKIQSLLFALPRSQLQSCLGNLDRLELASAVVVLLVARHRQVARLGIVGIYNKTQGKRLVLGGTGSHAWALLGITKCPAKRNGNLNIRNVCFGRK